MGRDVGSTESRKSGGTGSARAGAKLQAPFLGNRHPLDHGDVAGV